MNTGAFLLLSVPGFPLLMALVLALGGIRKTTLLLAPWMALPALLMTFSVTPGTSLEMSWLLLGSSLGIDETGRVFLFFTSLLWLLAGIYAAGYLASQAARLRFFTWYLFAMAGNLGLILAQDLAVFYTFFALMSFASYGLVVFEGTAEALRAGRIYIILVVIGEVLLFAGFVLAAQAAAGNIELDTVQQVIVGSAKQDWIIGLIFLGFGIKAGVIGLHFWLPLAHPVAPTPASAVLSGAMIAAGLLGWLRVLPLGEASFAGWGEAMTLVGLGSLYYAVLVGVVQQNAKTVLAYSSISKMGIMTMGIGLGMLAPQVWPLTLIAILIFALHHALVKGGLFLGAGMAAKAAGSKMQRRLIIGGLLILSLSLAGAPLTSGMLAKLLFKFPMMQITTPLLDWAQILLTLSALATTLLMARFLYLVWPQREVTEKNVAAPLTMWWSWLFLLAVVVMSPLFIPLVTENLHLSLEMLLGALWPAVVGGIGAALVWLVVRRRRLPALLDVPPGDVLFIVEKVIYPSLAAFLAWVFVTFPKAISSLFSACCGWRGNELFSAVVESYGSRLARWNTAIILLLATGLLVVVLLIH